jgi:hypothetical protein
LTLPTAILFIEGRLRIHHHDGRRAKANSGAQSVLVAYGQDNALKLKQSGIRGAFHRDRARVDRNLSPSGALTFINIVRIPLMEPMKLVEPMKKMDFGPAWWPDNLGQPSTSGGHQISGVSQRQGSSSLLAFTSRTGILGLDGLKKL